MKLTYRLHVDEFTASEAGNKAANLQLLIKRGYRVPEAIVLSISFFAKEDWRERASRLGVNLPDKLPSLSGWIVRSSSRIEDGSDISNAGRFESVVIRQSEQLADALEQVLSSGGSNADQLGVIIQTYVESEYSGIVFSVDPISGVQLPVIEAVRGRGELVVGGQVNPLTYREGEWDTKEDFPLPDHLTNEIAQAAIRMRQFLSNEVDMEFGIYEGVVYWLQIRPVTGMIEQMAGEWFLLDQCTEPVSPLDRSLDPSGLFHFPLWDVKFVHHYPYIQMKPVQPAGKTNQPVEIWEEWLEMKRKYEPVFEQYLLEDLSIYSIDALWHIILNRVDSLRKCFAEYLRREWLIERRHLTRRLKIHIQNALGEQVHFETILSLLASGLDTITARKTHLIHSLIKTAIDTSDFKVISANINRYPNHPWMQQFNQFIEEFAYESPQPVLSYLPTLEEAPEQLMALIKSSVAHGLLPDSNNAALEREHLISSIHASLSETDRLDFTDCLQRFRLAATRTENDDYMLQKGGASVRKALLAVGERLTDQAILEQPEHIFYLTSVEMEEVVQGKEVSCKELIKLRQEAIQKAQLYKPTQLIRNGAAVRGETGALKEEKGSSDLVGQIASAGIAKGTVFLVNNPLDRTVYERIPPHSIIVAPILSPSLVYNLVAAAAIVTETGGFLSHGAIFARERGIPALVGVESAISLLATGDHVIVDANEGKISFIR
ncbi:MAG: hypothetical protein K0Q81_1819 [Paenibacillus sp.]|nr:hypothetical protein [Paenibacillus sp.]